MDESSSISLSAYCTLRPKANEKTTKIVNKTQFNSLKYRRSTIDDNDSTIPYVPLENSTQSDTQMSIPKFNTIETKSDCPAKLTDDSIDCDLIDLFDSAPVEPDSCVPEVEAINVALLGKLQRKLSSPSFAAIGTSSMCNTLTKKPHTSECPEQRELQRLEHYCTLRKINPHKRKHILQNFASLRRTNKLSSDPHSFCVLHDIENVPNISGSSTPSISSALSCCDPDKIEDCLMELDAYLEEIDRNCVCNEINYEMLTDDDMFANRNIETIVNIEDESKDDGNNSVNEYGDLLNIFENNRDSDENPKSDECDLVNRRNSILLTENKSNVGSSKYKVKSTIFTDDDRSNNGSGVESISRGHQYRNTICVAPPRDSYQVQQHLRSTAFKGENYFFITFFNSIFLNLVKIERVNSELFYF